MQPVSYLQTDPMWANASYSAKGESTTIGRAGCGPTSMAMVLATWADKTVTPKTEAAWALAHGYKAPHQGTYYGYFPPAAKRYGLTCYQINGSSIYGNATSPYHTTAKNAVDNGDLVIACMGKGLWTSSGHYVVVWKIKGNMIYINDPASTKVARTHGNYLVFKQQVKYYWIIRKPKKEEPDLTEAETRKVVREEIEKSIPTIVQAVVNEIPKAEVYNTLEEVPDWGKKAVEKRLPGIKGTGSGLGITVDMLRSWVVADRISDALSYGMD